MVAAAIHQLVNDRRTDTLPAFLTLLFSAGKVWATALGTPISRMLMGIPCRPLMSKAGVFSGHSQELYLYALWRRGGEHPCRNSGFKGVIDTRDGWSLSRTRRHRIPRRSPGKIGSTWRGFCSQKVDRLKRRVLERFRHSRKKCAFFLTLRRFGRIHADGRFLRKIEEQLVQRDREIHPFSKTTDFERLPAHSTRFTG